MAFDEEQLIKASAVRCLSVFSRFSCLKEDLDFLENAIDITNKALIEPGDFVLKLKASWSIANFSDIFVLQGRNLVAKQTLINMFIACLSCSKSNEKIKTSIVRCLGNLLRISQNDELTALGPKVQQAIDFITQNIRSKESMKLKWNACHAAHNMMKNELIFKLDFNWQERVFDNLRHEAATSANFKVKISCANAMAAVEQRSCYGLFFTPCFKTLIDVLVDSNNLVDYNEYKHKEHLQEEVGSLFLISMKKRRKTVNLKLILGLFGDQSLFDDYHTRRGDDICQYR